MLSSVGGDAGACRDAPSAIAGRIAKPATAIAINSFARTDIAAFGLLVSGSVPGTIRGFISADLVSAVLPPGCRRCDGRDGGFDESPEPPAVAWTHAAHRSDTPWSRATILLLAWRSMGSEKRR